MKDQFRSFVVRAITSEARKTLRRYSPKIITVTGSVGKTSAKDAIYTALAGTLFVRKNDKSFNSEIGTPLTILGLPNGWSNPVRWLLNIIQGGWIAYGPLKFQKKYPEWLILEVGADKPGDISSIAKWLHPDIAVVTRIPDVPVHIEFFPSKEAVISEKSSIVKALKKKGSLILNADDENVLGIKLMLSPNTEQQVITFGFSERADIQGRDARIQYDKDGRPEGVSFVASWKNVPETYVRHEQHLFVPGALGSQHVYPLLVALSVAYAQGVDMTKAAEQLSRHIPPKGRMNVIEGRNGSVIIDDSYNSSPVASAEALSTLKEIKVPEGAKKIAILGDMMELGQYSVAEHVKAGEQAADSADIFIAVGIRAKGMAAAARGARADMEVYEMKDSMEAADMAKQILRDTPEEGSVVLVKGSQSMRMEKAAAILMADPLDVHAKLVRQEPEWLARV